MGKNLGRQEILLLTTTGRKSGKKRSVPLAAINYEGRYLVVASFGGSPVHPAWFLNIRDNSVVQIRLGAVILQANASIIEKTNSIYEELWDKAVDTYQGFDSYKKATTRNIPIVVLEPVY